MRTRFIAKEWQVALAALLDCATALAGRFFGCMNKFDRGQACAYASHGEDCTHGKAGWGLLRPTGTGTIFDASRGCRKGEPDATPRLELAVHSAAKHT